MDASSPFPDKGRMVTRERTGAIIPVVGEVVDSPALELIAVPPVRDSLVARPPDSSASVITINDNVRKWVSNRGLVVVLLLTCGPLGLPALWFSPRFSNTTKTVTTVVFLLLTFLVPIAFSWYWLDIAVRPVLEALKPPVK